MSDELTMGDLKIASLELREGDILIVKSDRLLSLESRYYLSNTITDSLRAAGKQNQVMIIDDDLEVSVLRDGK